MDRSLQNKARSKALVPSQGDCICKDVNKFLCTTFSRHQLRCTLLNPVHSLRGAPTNEARSIPRYLHVYGGILAKLMFPVDFES